jgi:NAD(P)-dependent dehydrogenase (short-subunit alcohol dehydrogenase family)
MTLAPLCVFADALSASQGAFLLISSEAAAAPVRQWPHYIAAKRAAEALVDVAALQYPAIRFLTFRAPKLLTEMTNTPVGRVGAVRTETVAAQILRMYNPPARGD